MTLENLLEMKCSDQNIHQSAAHLLISVHILHPGIFRHIPVNYERSAHFYSDENTPIALDLDTVPLLTPPFCIVSEKNEPKRYKLKLLVLKPEYFGMILSIKCLLVTHVARSSAAMVLT